MNTWKEYQEKTKDAPARELLIIALPFVKAEHPIALDFGAGALRDTKHLLKEGYGVIALDLQQPILHDPHLTQVRLPFERYKFPKSIFDLVNGQYAFPFIPTEDFREVWNDIHDSLKPGGIITGQLFGDRDEWDHTCKFAYWQTFELFTGYEILKWSGEEYDKETISGHMKHWHVFEFIARKR